MPCNPILVFLDPASKTGTTFKSLHKKSPLPEGPFHTKRNKVRARQRPGPF